MPCRAQSNARVLPIPANPALDAVYATRRGSPTMLLIDPMRTIDPGLLPGMSRRAKVCAARNAPVRLVAIMASQSSSSPFSAEAHTGPSHRCGAAPGDEPAGKGLRREKRPGEVGGYYGVPIVLVDFLGRSVHRADPRVIHQHIRDAGSGLEALHDLAYLGPGGDAPGAYAGGPP